MNTLRCTGGFKTGVRVGRGLGVGRISAICGIMAEIVTGESTVWWGDRCEPARWLWCGANRRASRRQRSGRNRWDFLELERSFGLMGLCYDRLSHSCTESTSDLGQRLLAIGRTARLLRWGGEWDRIRRILGRRHGDSRRCVRRNRVSSREYI